MKIRFVYLIVSVLSVFSCTQKHLDDPGDKDLNLPDGNVKVSFRADRKTVLKNPLSGWVIYAPLMEDVDGFWKKYDNMNSAVGKVRVSDYATVLYLRGSWTDFNPEKGVYIWQDNIDYARYPKAKSLKALEEGAKARGLKLAFTLKTDSRDANAFCTPEYVRQEMLKEYDGDENKGLFWFQLGSVGNERTYWSPFPDDPVFQKWYEIFIRALAAEYNDPHKTMFISGLGMGLWGEYHTCRYSTGDEKPRQAVFEWVTDLYVSAFDKVPVVTNYHKLVGTTRSSGNADPLTPILLASAIEKGFSMRHDAFGMKQSYGYGEWERNFIANWTYKVPVLGEGGWIYGSSNFSCDYASVRELRAGEYEEMRGARCNMMDLRYSSKENTGDTYSWFNDAYDLLTRFIEEGCYRLYPDLITYPAECRNGTTVTIQHRWLNIGNAYCPTNIKQYKDRFKVAFALLDEKSGEPVRIYHDETAHPHDWTGGRHSYELKVDISGVPAGNYFWGCGITDALDEDRIGIYLGAQGDYTKGNWLKLGKVSVVK